MTQAEARLLTNETNKKLALSISEIEKRIKEKAASGNSVLILSYKECPESMREELQKRGFRIGVYSEIGIYW